MQETKWFFPLKGTTEFVVEFMDEGHNECVARFRNDELTQPTRVKYSLNSSLPSVLCVPPGNWFCIEQYDGAEVMVFSDGTIGEYECDELRRPL